MITVQNLTKYYGDNLAVDNISFNIDKGEVVGFLGPNGAGKSTTVRIITCFLSASSGSVKVDDLDIVKNSLEVRQRIGYLPENTPLYSDMNVIDYIKFMYAMRGKNGKLAKSKIDELIDSCSLEKVVSKNISEISKGYRQRVGLAQALAHDPEILILDEPTVGLDPNQIIEIRNLIKNLGREKTVILCSHILPEVEATCDRVLIINDGSIVADGSPHELQASFEGKVLLSLQIKGNPDSFLNNVVNINGVEGISSSNSLAGEMLEINLEASKSVDPREDIFKFCIENGSILYELKREEISLEDIFRKLTGKEQSNGPNMDIS